MTEDEFKKAAKKIVKQHHPQIPDEHIDLHSDSSYYWGPENFAQTGDWLRRTVSILDNPNRFSNADVFINFFGVIDDSETIAFLKEKSIGSLSVLGYSETDLPRVIEGIEDVETKQYFQAVWKARNLFEPIQKTFSDDEKFLLKFLRHRHCHTTLNNFAVKIDTKGEEVKIKTANWERIVGISKATTVAEFRSRLFAKLESNKTDLYEVARILTPPDANRLFPE